MLTVNIHEAKTRLSELIARAVAGEAFIIAKAGKPLVKVEALDRPELKVPQRIGFAKGRWTIPDDATWAAMDREIEAMFDDSAPLDWGAASDQDAAGRPTDQGDVVR